MQIFTQLQRVGWFKCSNTGQTHLAQVTFGVYELKVDLQYKQQLPNTNSTGPDDTCMMSVWHLKHCRIIHIRYYLPYVNY